MPDLTDTIASLGNTPPLLANGRNGPPDRRDVSARWLSGTFLTGLTSTILMGVALLAALDGREQLATPPEVAAIDTISGGSSGEVAKAARVIQPRAPTRSRDRRRMEVSTVTRIGDRDVIRTLPFVQVRMALAAPHTPDRDYPAFDPLEVFAEDGASATASAGAMTGLIYGAKVESEVSMRTVDFPLVSAAFDERSELSADEVEEVVRTTGAILTDGDIQVAALHYVDPLRFGESLATSTLTGTFGFRVVQENVSTFARSSGIPSSSFVEDVIAVRAEREVRDIFADAGLTGPETEAMATEIGRMLNSSMLRPETVLRLGIESTGDVARLVRTSIYHRRNHILTIAADDLGRLGVVGEPERSQAVAAAFEDAPAPVRARGELPRVYDGIYRAAFSYGMSGPMTRQLIRLLASDVDFRSRVSPGDEIEVFFSQPSENDFISDESELLYVKASFGGAARSFYRFRMEDGTVDYFDQDGRSARQFLLRNPVPNGRLTSGFGGRRHPILGYSRMHTGVDWAAPRGTPIIASGNGVVEKAGWTGGYGRQTIIRHSNGYTSSYSHQHAIAEGVVPGARVRQGQVIGYVGSTGLSSGNHLHYELIVNGNKVDPMRVRLPTGRVLKDAELAAFQRERERIDALLADDEQPLSLASNRIVR